MTLDTFGIPEIYKSQEEESFLGEGFSMQIGSDSDSKDNLLAQRIVNTLTAQLQSILPGTFRITPLPEQCLSYANLHSWSPGRSYFSLFEMQQSKSVWILHLSRSVGEGLASLSHSKNSRIYSNIYHDLREADSVIYLETADMLRRLFGSLLELWPASDKLKIARCRHILQLSFLQEVAQDEEYVVLPFYLDNKVCTGDIHLIFPQRHLLNIVGA
ncbi:MAG: hypothetical protein P8O73_04080 [SAR324 cluster bacterium]|nr:hypothetical protein [SAR324 cluster bacterium]MEE3266970.1 hypothetical protein [SAR324 cluster bacterium]